MARINLLPWRAERRKQRQKDFMVMLGLSAVAGLVLWFLVNSYYNAQLSGQNDRNAYLQQQITQVDTQIKEIDELDKKKAKLLARKEVIEQLQANRSQMVHLFDELVKTIPASVRLTSMKQNADSMVLYGVAQSNASVAEYMRNLDGSPWMGNADLDKTQIQYRAGRMPYTFGLRVKLSQPNAEEPGKTSVLLDDSGTPSAGSSASAVSGGAGK